MRPLIYMPIIGNFMHFLRAGDTVDSVVVSATGKPDITPSTNWPQLGVVKSVTPEFEEIENKWDEPQANGTYLRRSEPITVASYLDVELEGVVDIALEMMFGISKAASGVAQIPGNVNARHVEGWIKYQARQVTGAVGTDLVVSDQWVQASLKTAPKFSAQRATCVMRFQLLPSNLNTVVIN